MSQLHALLSLVAGSVALYVAALSRRFARAPGWGEQRWFSWAALSVAAYSILNLPTTLSLSDPLVYYTSRAQLACAAAHTFAWIRYSRELTPERPCPLERWIGRAVALLGLAGALTGLAYSLPCVTHTFPPLGLAYRAPPLTAFGELAVGTILLSLLLPVFRFVRAWRRGVPAAAVLAASLALLLALGLNDAMVTAGWYEAPYLVDLGFVVPTAAVGWALTSRFVDDARQLALLRTELARQVDERTGELRSAHDRLSRAEKLAAIGQLAAGVAHEVNNPASVVSANVESVLAADPNLSPASREALRDASRAIQHVTTIVRQLLDAGRLAVDGSAALRPVKVRPLVDAAAAASRARASAAVRVVNDVPEDLHVRAHERILQQVLANLLVNGAQAIPAGRPGTLRVSAEVAGERALLRVDDDGAGMTPEVLRRAFDPFFTTKPFGAGTGLGLSVSRGLVADLGGELRLESSAGAGTRATIELAHAAAPAGADEGADPSAAPVPRVGGRRVRLLAVDDDEAVRAALVRRLAPAYDVEVAGGVTEALARLQEEPRFDVVLCDVMMPDGGGERLQAALRERAPDLARRLVFLTAGAVGEETQRFLAEQPQPVLLKPVDVDYLHRLVAYLCAGRDRAA